VNVSVYRLGSSLSIDSSTSSVDVHLVRFGRVVPFVHISTASVSQWCQSGQAAVVHYCRGAGNEAPIPHV